MCTEQCAAIPLELAMAYILPRTSAPVNKYQIIADAERHVASLGSQYSSWVVGVTDSPDRRRDEHCRKGRLTWRWRYWDAETEDDARAVELYFLGKGMQGGPGGSGSANYVYVF